MRRFWITLALILSACASNEPVPGEPQEQGALTTPGMIPSQCESLLQKSQDWGYHPEKAGTWRPSSVEQGLEVAAFFAQFSLTPAASTVAIRDWARKPAPDNEDDAKASIEELNNIQLCNLPITMTLLDGIVKFSWKNREQKQEVGQSVLRFLLNQQARPSSLAAIAFALKLTERAKQKGFISGSPAPIVALQTDLNKFVKTNMQKNIDPDSYLEREKRARMENAYTEELREKLAKHLPLP